MGEAKHLRSASRIVFSVFIAIIAVYAVYFLPLPLFIFKPGTAENVRPMVQIEEFRYEDKGEFMLTTVSVSGATLFGYLKAMLNGLEEVRLQSELLQGGETIDEYSQRQEAVMLSSQANAIQAAYKKLGIPYEISRDGVMVVQVHEGVPARGVLRPGDVIVKAGDKPVRTTEELQEELQGKRAGDAISLTFRRDGTDHTAEIELAVLPLASGEPGGNAPERRAGLGIVSANVQSVKASSPDKQVHIQAGEIGGPSAGLMFALEIYNRLSPHDISKGYKIAGTGMIDTDGNVGQIGGIQHKVVAADRAGADIFFSPKDYTSPDGKLKAPNYSDALARAKQIGSRMSIVPVGTIDEALQYLAGLDPKQPGS
ncbi:SepM family pheromone-processing serine protease [Paenibacillus ginsengihumi]|uniref:SepM family pheromone-processing serine protease n=1 Tax=Paenibacillus ginsengihumi TaxID=431596 RepID=UPI00037BFCAA|nr:SepM family pheromone-processing serine protease [Paenibacillus ginsengihumi]